MAATPMDSTARTGTGADELLTLPARAVRVLLISDVRLYREGMALALGADTRVCVIGAVGRDGAVAKLALEPDVVLIDVGSEPMLECTRSLAAAPGTPPIVAFAVSETESSVLACIEAGVAAYAPQGASHDELVTVILHVLRGEAVCSPRVAGSLFRRIASLAASADARLTPDLTPREVQVLHLLGRRLSNKEIASELHIELATVKNHVHNILDKLRVESREQAVRRGRAHAGTVVP